jgi:uncharacterized protein YndB with AHSA1/START domain
MLVKVLVALAVLVVAGAVVVATRPSEFRVTRTGTISAPPAVVFAQVNDFHKWEAWNPWGKLDPAMKQSYEGAPAGVGAVYTWAGNSQVGEGHMTLTESRPNELIRIKMEFLKPFAATSTAEFTLPARRQRDGRDVEHGGPEQLHGQDHAPRHEHGQDDRRPVREGAGGDEVGGGSGAEVIARR